MVGFKIIACDVVKHIRICGYMHKRFGKYHYRNNLTLPLHFQTFFLIYKDHVALCYQHIIVSIYPHFHVMMGFSII